MDTTVEAQDLKDLLDSEYVLILYKQTLGMLLETGNYTKIFIEHDRRDIREYALKHLGLL